VQLSELLYQKIQGLGAQGTLALRPGYVAVVCRSPALRHAVLAVLFPGPGDEKRLSDGSGGPTRVGLGLAAPSGPVRVLRELGSDRQLLRPDAATKKFAPISKDALEIESFLRLECGLPALEVYGSAYVLDAAELPSQRGIKEAAASDIDQPRVATLKAELEATKKYEELQDALFRASDRLNHIETAAAKEAALKEELARLDSHLGKVSYTPEQTKNILARAARMKEEEKKRDDELAKVGAQRRNLQSYSPPPPEPFHKSTLFSGGLAAGVLVDAVAVLLKRPSVALLGLAGFGAALVAVLQWIEGDEADELRARHVDELKDREDRIKREFLEKMGPVRNAMRAAEIDSVTELVALFEERKIIDDKRAGVAEKLKKLQDEEKLADVGAEREKLVAEKLELEAKVSAQGFARPLSTIEAELKQALGLTSGEQKKAQVPDAEVPKAVFGQAAQALGMAPEMLASAIEPRLAAYLTALTDKRVVAGRMDGNGQLMLSTPDGRWGAYPGLPMPLRDLAYLALRLALLERIGQAKKLPLLVEDVGAALEPAKKTLLGRMLKGIAAHAQVIHRVAEPPPAGTADAVVNVP
jgi:hypothetical protein